MLLYGADNLGSRHLPAGEEGACAGKAEARREYHCQL